MKIYLIFCSVLFYVFTAHGLQEEASFSSASRQEYLQKEILALKEISTSTLKSVSELVDSYEKQKCRSLFEPLTLKCFLREADSYCQKSGPKCLLLWDILITNKMNEKLYISNDERFKIAENSSNFPQAYSQALRTKYAALVTQMLLSNHNSCNDNDSKCLAESLDQFCLKHANSKGMSWQSCASALVWFIRNID